MILLDPTTDDDISNSVEVISKSGRGVRIGSRAARVIRILKLIRASRMFKLYRQTKLNLMNANLATSGDTMMMMMDDT